MNELALLATTIIACLCGCDSILNSNTERSGLTGSERDEHGCINSAGYHWCERTNQCERPWELAEKEGFENAREQFDAYCSGQ